MRSHSRAPPVAPSSNEPPPAPPAPAEAPFTEVVARRGWNSPSSSGSSAGRKPAALTGSPSPLSSLGRSSCERDDPPRANVLRRNSFGVLYRAALFNASKQSPSPLFHDTQ